MSDSATVPFDPRLTRDLVRTKKSYARIAEVSASAYGSANQWVNLSSSVDTASNDNVRKYGFALRALAVVSVACITFGLVAAVLLPNRITGVIFPLGLLLFWITGAIARR